MNHADELEKCKSDFVYWVETYAQIPMNNQKGIPKLFDNQLVMANVMGALSDTDTGVEATQYRQTGSTTIINLFSLWKVLFGDVSSIKIVSINERKFGYVLKSLIFPLEFLPDWMLSYNKVTYRNKHGIWFENGSSITTRLEWHTDVPTFIHFDLFDFLPTTMKHRVIEWLKLKNRPSRINFICSCTGIPYMNHITTDMLLKILES